MAGHVKDSWQPLTLLRALFCHEVLERLARLCWPGTAAMLRLGLDPRSGQHRNAAQNCRQPARRMIEPASGGARNAEFGRLLRSLTSVQEAKKNV